MTNGKRGWNYLINARKWHYFMEDGTSLCAKWIIFSNNEDATNRNDNDKGNCKACSIKLRQFLQEANNE